MISVHTATLEADTVLNSRLPHGKGTEYDTRPDK
jgi:hypothetical protein